jgi:tRNA U55 pseudouridine synthase TruB
MKHLATSVKVACEDIDGAKKAGHGGLLDVNHQN